VNETCKETTSVSPDRGGGTPLQAKPNEPPTQYHGTGEASWELALRQGDILARVATSDGTETRIIRLPDGQLALGCFHSVAVGSVCGEMLREYTLQPVSTGLTIGSINDLAELTTAMNAVAKALGPSEGG